MNKAEHLQLLQKKKAARAAYKTTMSAAHVALAATRTAAAARVAASVCKSEIPPVAVSG